MSVTANRAKAELKVVGDDANRLIRVGDTGSLGDPVEEWIPKAQITALILSNRDSVERWASVGVQSETANLVYLLHEYVIGSNETLVFTMPVVLLAGEYLVAWAEVADVVGLSVAGFDSVR